MQLRSETVPQWPPLAWIARLTPGDNVIRVWHGPRVETRGDDALFEAVWAGDVDDADFDRTDVVFGSGIRLRDDTATFVSSGTTVDRLQWAEANGHTWVSNSLVCLLKQLDATLDPTDGGYYNRFGSVCAGLLDYAKVQHTSAGPVNLTYFNNLRWNGRQLETGAKPHTVDGFKSFADFRAYLSDSIRRVAANLADPRRQFPYEMLGTISSGYDSPTVATLAAEVGLKNVISFHHVRFGREDCGHEVAGALGLNLSLVNREAWRNSELPEVPFIASDAKGEDVFFHGARDRLPGKVLLTGYHGDKMWDKNTKIVGPNIVRGDRSGLSMSEYRLCTGYINMAVPFIGVRHHADVHAINNSEEMRPWDVGGDYTRPVCRRIVEEAGVARECFGAAKIGTSVLFGAARNVQSASTIADYHAWMRDHAPDFWRRGRVPPQMVLEPAQWLARRAWGVHERLKGLPPSLQFVRSTVRTVASLGDRDYLSKYMFPWAVDRAKRRYVVPAQADERPAPAIEQHEVSITA